MKRIINWIKHEYCIAKDIDKPTHRDYQIVYFLYWWVLTPLMVFLYLLSCIVLSWILPIPLLEALRKMKILTAEL